MCRGNDKDRRASRRLSGDRCFQSSAELERELLGVRSELDEIVRSSRSADPFHVRTVEATLHRVGGEIGRGSGFTLQSSIDGLEDRLTRIPRAREERRLGGLSSAGRQQAQRPTSVALLKKFRCSGNAPNWGVTTREGDLVIGSQDRANKGRAQSHRTAFVIGLMKYCRRHDIPHPVSLFWTRH
jgi:hypothetical protein